MAELELENPPEVVPSLRDIVARNRKGGKPAEASATVATAPDESVETPVDDLEINSNFPADVLDDGEEVETVPDEDTSTASVEDGGEELLKKGDESKEDRAWADVKHKLKEALASNEEGKRRIAELEAELQKAALSPEKEEQRQAEIQSYKEQIGQLEITKHPDFKAKYDQQVMARTARAKKALQQYEGLDSATAEKVVNTAYAMEPKQMARYLMNEAPELHGMLTTILFEAHEIAHARSEAIKDWRATNAAIEETKEHTQKVQSVQQLDATLGKAISEIDTAGNRYYRRSRSETPDALAWNQSVDLREQAVRRILLEKEPAAMARYVAEGFITGELRKELGRVKGLATGYKKQLDEVRAAKTPVSAGTPPAQPPPPAKDIGTSGLSMSEIVKRNRMNYMQS